LSLMPQKEEYKEYTYEEWLELDNNEYIELIDGVLYDRNALYMRGEPSRRHMDIVREFTVKLGVFLIGKTCKLYTNPFMVKLNEKTVVHPDISVICDPDKLNDRGCNGAPDLIIEILSLSNMADDMWVKYNKYLMAGVKEYWIIDPIKNLVTVHVFENGEYSATLYSDKDILPVTVLPGCEIDLKVIFTK